MSQIIPTVETPNGSVGSLTQLPVGNPHKAAPWPFVFKSGPKMVPVKTKAELTERFFPDVQSGAKFMQHQVGVTTAEQIRWPSLYTKCGAGLVQEAGTASVTFFRLLGYGSSLGAAYQMAKQAEEQSCS